MSNYYMGLVTVKVKAPEGYKPRTITYKVGYFSQDNTKQFRDETTISIAEDIKSKLKEKNKDIELKVTASVEVTPIISFELKFPEIVESDESDNTRNR